MTAAQALDLYLTHVTPLKGQDHAQRDGDVLRLSSVRGFLQFAGDITPRGFILEFKMEAAGRGIRGRRPPLNQRNRHNQLAGLILLSTARCCLKPEFGL